MELQNMTNQDIFNPKSLPHLVILGAGATMAAIPNGDKYGQKSSLMEDFIRNLNLDNLFKGIILNTKSENLEDIYNELYERQDCVQIRSKLEERIRIYFSKLRLPDKPTLYDLLILSLRKKDAIASFNWDPLLLEAYNRINHITRDLPEIIFLHGNVNAGFCKKDKIYGILNQKCTACENKFEEVPLLYPIKDKDYTSNIFIKEQWYKTEQYLQKAQIITIFGYGAPNSDKGAMELLQNGYGSSLRPLDEVEIIDKCKDEKDIYQTWSHFDSISHEHLKIYRQFFDSYLAKFPRRSVEALNERNKGWWGPPTNEFRNDYHSFEELEAHIKLTIDVELLKTKF